MRVVTNYYYWTWQIIWSKIVKKLQKNLDSSWLFCCMSRAGTPCLNLILIRSRACQQSFKCWCLTIQRTEMPKTVILHVPKILNIEKSNPTYKTLRSVFKKSRKRHLKTRTLGMTSRLKSPNSQFQVAKPSRESIPLTSALETELTVRNQRPITRTNSSNFNTCKPLSRKPCKPCIRDSN